ncbi:hypothetical protein EC973_003401 [Apophysomyces ossiformis]|uniref:Uncharacterized protein n=1 Tax=Apophysomyces ossiformis TaxID=679940 RepID=A0A8H7BXW9_9FUNG|nr:hypothetical protein EC973_003401 [Apophysomyces ossiformis]
MQNTRTNGEFQRNDVTVDFVSPPPTPPPPHVLMLPEHAGTSASTYSHSLFIKPPNGKHNPSTNSNHRMTLPQSENSHDEQAPSKRALLWGHLKYFVIATIRFALKNNNLALIINLVHHLWSARTLLRRPVKVIARSWQRQQLPPFASPSSSTAVAWATNYSSQKLMKDVFRAMGVMHLAFAMLTGLALKERRRSTQRSALLVLTMASVGQAWARTMASGVQWAGRHALRDTGVLDAIVFLVSSVAFSRTFRR